MFSKAVKALGLLLSLENPSLTWHSEFCAHHLSREFPLLLESVWSCRTGMTWDTTPSLFEESQAETSLRRTKGLPLNCRWHLEHLDVLSINVTVKTNSWRRNKSIKAKRKEVDRKRKKQKLGSRTGQLTVNQKSSTASAHTHTHTYTNTHTHAHTHSYTQSVPTWGPIWSSDSMRWIWRSSKHLRMIKGSMPTFEVQPSNSHGLNS